jgi:hypothetical protein
MKAGMLDLGLLRALGVAGFLGTVAVGCGCPAASTPATTAVAPAAAGADDFFAGDWIGTGYTCSDGSSPREELVRTTMEHGVAITKKTIGDNCVLVGDVTWKGTPAGESFPVKAQIGVPGVSRTFIDARVTRRSADTYDLTTPTWTVKFRRAPASH